ncbi:phosphatidylserine decarboxylase family protein [Candidatus Magnetominusculus xianensis]|uniref:Phosphatidylserine decarboxylase proenzyme n=1 Tax=Candidatus Magnetominusculus xianensis TaxID=1748249 RepID=A0ABR5SI68_9BACT|nr:phosphatidylserine decarboxylase family protein [Candidatus Magnetominusculus xianensis]KWT92020.1 phosphatidylserine decarboxylase [Candidatus Magnetominusculus xianensis]MBF0405246.1 phosphatidylserine decarboxylase family protein [Nitrospirota bacterium]
MIKFAPEGLPFIAGAAAVTVAVLAALRNWIAFIPFVITLFMFYFFRDPERATPVDAGAVISPADGRILLVTEVKEEEFIGKEVRKISIFMSPLNVHVNRAPYDGEVVSVKHTPGSFKKAFLDEASLHNDNIAMVLRTTKGDILLRQIAGSIARRAVCRVKPGDALKQGQRYGIIKFSSRVDIYLPLSAKVIVKPEDKVLSGETVIARWDEGAAK